MHHDLVIEYPQWKNRIEVQYFSLQGLKTFRSRTTKLAVISPGDPLHIVDAGKDWLMNWFFVQDYGVTLFGPAPSTIIDHISKNEFLKSVKGHAMQWRIWVKKTKTSRPYQSYAILTLCRALCSYKSGKQVSKKFAATWVQKKFPEWAPLIRSALRWRAVARQNKKIDHKTTFPLTVRFVNFMINKINKII